MKRGVVERDKDISGITGTGVVAEFCVSSFGPTVVFWNGGGHSYHESLKRAIKVHGHEGKTRFVILDEPTERDLGHCNECHRLMNGPFGHCFHHDKACPACLKEAG